MLKKVINYTDFDGNAATITAYFNLNKTECVDLNLEYEEEGGLLGRMKKLLTEKEDGQIRQKPAVDFVKLLLEKSYGVRPKEDPSLFIKEDDFGRPLFKKFKQTAAYDKYLFDLLTGAESLDEFASGVLPYITDEQKAEAEQIMKREGLDKIVNIPTAEA